MSKKSIFNWALFVCILGLAVVCFLSIYNDIAFDEAKKEREAIVIERLMKLRDAEEKFKASHSGLYCGDIDSLVDWVRDSMAVDKVIKEGELTDDQLEAGLTEQMAVAQGLIKRDTVWVKASEILGVSSADSLKLIPIGKPGGVFEIRKDLKYNTKSQEWDQLCEIRASLDDYMDGMDAKHIKSLKSDLDKRNKSKSAWTTEGEDEDLMWYGLRIGDLKDAGNKMAGNWE
ncbi:MAG: hypothetical protein Q4A08_02060 [Bacteroidales bacterium]|nr:hypothetical protein [Bacteroidales bacterium]